MGGCPCPRCLIHKGQIHQVGTECDKVQRKLFARTNDNVYQEKIREARVLIYEKNWAVESRSSAAPSQASIASTNSSKSGEPAVVSKLKLETECVFRTLFAIPLQLL